MTPSPSHTSRGRAPLAAVAVALGLSGLPVAATVSAESFTEAVVQRAIDSRPAEHAGAAARNRTEPSEAEASATATQATAKAEGGAPALPGRRLQEAAIPGTCASDQLAERGQAAMQSCCAGGEAECTQLPERCIGPGSFFFFFFLR